MPGEQYYLFLIAKDGKEYRVYSKPLSIEVIDKRTTTYESQEELVAKIIKNTNLNLKSSDIQDVRIRKKKNANEEIYFDERGPLYKKDKDVLNIEETKRKLIERYHDMAFLSEFLKFFDNISNFRSILYEIRAAIATDKSYLEPFNELVSKYSKTYKGCRNIYFMIKDYDEKVEERKKSKISLNPEDVGENSKKYI